MAKPFKIFLWIVGTFIALIVVAAIALPLLIDPNDYKDDAATAVNESTGRELRINGDIDLTVFPWLGLSVADVTLGNAPGFGPEPFAQVAEMNVGVRLMPLLLRREVQVGTIRIDGLALNLAKAADGANNWSDFGAAEQAPAEPEAPREPGQPIAFTIGGLDIKNATFRYVDKQSGGAYTIDRLALQTGAIELGEPLDVTLAFVVNSAKPLLESDVKIAFTALANLDMKVYEVKDLKVDSTTKGESVPGGSQKASVRGHARYDQNAGTFAFSDGVLEAAGLTINAAIQGRGLAEPEGAAREEGEKHGPVFTGSVSSNSFNPREVAKAFGVALPPSRDAAAMTQAQFSAKYEGNFDVARLDELKFKLDQTTAAGSVGIRNFASPQVLFTLKADAFDADRYMAPAAEPKGGGAGEKKEDFKAIEIPVEALDALDAVGNIQLGTLKVKGLSLTNVRIAVNAPKGQAKTQEMTATLYGGRITQSARFSHASPARYDLKLGLDAVNSAPLLKDLIGKSYLSGLGNFNLNVSSGGVTVGDVLKGLSGALATSFRDGAVEGFNLDETLAGARALYRGQPPPQTGAPKRTEFKDLKAAGKIANGILDTDNLDVKGSWYQLAGDGQVNLVEQTVNYILYPTVTGGDEKLKELQGTKIPIKVSGSWYDPKVKVDLEGVLKGRVKEELKQQEDKVREKARDKIGDFLRKKLPPPQEPAPEQAPSEGEPPAEEPPQQ